MNWSSFSFVDRHIVFRALVNETLAINLLLDTGAGQSATFETVGRKLRLATQDSREEVRTIAGSHAQVPVVAISCLKTGAVVHDQVVCLLLPDHMQADPSFDAVVGSNVLSAMKILIDFPQRNLAFLKEDEGAPLSGMSLVRFDIRENVPIVSVDVGGKPTDALLDTGSGETVVFREPVARHDKRKTTSITLGPGLSFDVEAEVQPLAELSRGLRIGAILGNDMWTDCLLLIDYSGARLGVKRERKRGTGTLPTSSQRDVRPYSE